MAAALEIYDPFLLNRHPLGQYKITTKSCKTAELKSNWKTCWDDTCMHPFYICVPVISDHWLVQFKMFKMLLLSHNWLKGQRFSLVYLPGKNPNIIRNTVFHMADPIEASTGISAFQCVPARMLIYDGIWTAQQLLLFQLSKFWQRDIQSFKLKKKLGIGNTQKRARQQSNW